ncbi:hypothetical protein JW710_00220 [Candidatus Dojkabacteria bacterium]|nr:hypothetical protein [Candidatus Dojkabacteria bacterium]
MAILAALLLILLVVTNFDEIAAVLGYVPAVCCDGTGNPDRCGGRCQGGDSGSPACNCTLGDGIPQCESCAGQEDERETGDGDAQFSLQIFHNGEPWNMGSVSEPMYIFIGSRWEHPLVIKELLQDPDEEIVCLITPLNGYDVFWNDGGYNGERLPYGKTYTRVARHTQASSGFAVIGFGAVTESDCTIWVPNEYKDGICPTE